MQNRDVYFEKLFCLLVGGTPSSVASLSTPESNMEDEMSENIKDPSFLVPNTDDDNIPEDGEIPPSPDLPLHDISRYKINPLNLYEDIEQFDEEEDFNSSPELNEKFNMHNSPMHYTNGESPNLKRHNSRTEKPRLITDLDNIHQTSPLINRNQYDPRMLNTWNDVQNEDDQFAEYQPLYSNVTDYPDEYSNNRADEYSNNRPTLS